MKPANLAWCAPWVIAFAGAACSPSATALPVAIPAQPATVAIAPPPQVVAAMLPPPPAPGERPDSRQLRSMPLLITECQGFESLFAATPSASRDWPLLILRLRSTYAELARAAERAGAVQVLQGARDSSAKYDALLAREYAAWCVTGRLQPLRALTARSPPHHHRGRPRSTSPRAAPAETAVWAPT